MAEGRDRGWEEREWGIGSEKGRDRDEGGPERQWWGKMGKKVRQRFKEWSETGKKMGQRGRDWARQG